MHDRRSRAFDERGHLDRGRAALVDDEVSMQLRDDGSPLTGALEAGGLDQPSRRVSRRVHEDAPAVLGLDGLSLIALPGQLRHQALGLLPIATLELDRRIDDKRAAERAISKGRRAIPELQVVHAPRAPVRAGLESARGHQDLAQLMAPAAGVLIDRSAHRARHADRELEAAQAGVGGDPRQSHHLHARTRPDARAVNLVFAVDDANDEPLDPRVRDEQVGARPEQEMWDGAHACWPSRRNIRRGRRCRTTCASRAARPCARLAARAARRG